MRASPAERMFQLFSLPGLNVLDLSTTVVKLKFLTWRPFVWLPSMDCNKDNYSPHSQDAVGCANRRQARLVEPDSEVRKLLKDTQTSNFQKYKQLVSGEASLLRFLWFELITGLCSDLRGGLGIYVRQKVLQPLFGKCGRGVVIGRNVTIRHPQRIELGNNVVIDDNVVLDAKSSAPGASIRIADGTVIGRNSMLVCKGGEIDIQRNVNISVNCTLISETQLRIGEKTLLGGHCYIVAGGNHGVEFSGVPFVDQPRKQKGGVDIRANCWIGAKVTVLDGLVIGPDTVIGAAALVHRTVPPACIAAGVPATVLPADNGQPLVSPVPT